MTMRRTLPLLLLVAACDSPAESEAGGTIDLAGATEYVPESTQYSTGAWRVECGIEMSASLFGGSSNATATWTDATLTWTGAYDGLETTTDTLSAQETADFWGGEQVAAGAPKVAHWQIWDAEPFHVSFDFGYRVGSSGVKRATHSVRCQPPVPPLEGLYTLETIDGNPLPERSWRWDLVHYDTLIFYPNLTYEGVLRVSGIDYDYTLPHELRPYRLLPGDSIYMRQFAGWAAMPHHMSRSGDTITITVDIGYTPDVYVYRRRE